MGRYIGPLTKVSRRLGVFVGGDLESFQKRNFPPGQHGRTQGRKNFQTMVLDYKRNKIEISIRWN
jgi:hypothetical protein